MEENKNVGGSCCMQNKSPFFVGALGLFFAAWVLLSVADKVGLGLTSIFSRRSLTVTGASQSQQANETARFTATVSVKDADKAKAVSQVNEKSQKLVDEVKQFGILDKDIKTQSLNIYQDQETYYDNGVQKYRLGNWNASLSVEITLRDIARSSDLTALLAKLDTSSLWGPDFSVNQENINEEELLAKAYVDAKKKAEGLAKSMGRQLGRATNVVEGYDSGGVIYPLRDTGMGAGGGGGIEPGSTSVSKTVTVTFELK